MNKPIKQSTLDRRPEAHWVETALSGAPSVKWTVRLLFNEVTTGLPSITRSSCKFGHQRQFGTFRQRRSVSGRQLGAIFNNNRPSPFTSNRFVGGRVVQTRRKMNFWSNLSTRVKLELQNLATVKNRQSKRMSKRQEPTVFSCV